nr:hypothetical protein [Pseudomonas aeruginosa]
MLHRLLLSLMTASALVLGGCALSPQQLDPQPVLKGPLTAVGHGQPVVVKVVDGRPGPSLGTRGGLYADTSTLTVRSEDVVPKLQAQAETAVRLLGYTPSANAYNAPQLTRRYTGRYGASLNQRFGMAPNQATNSKLVSEVLSDALTRVFKDPTIAQTLGQQ